MNDETRAITWEAPEHRHIEKTGDWYWAVSIIAIAASVVSIIFENILFGVVILLAASTMILFGHRSPKMMPFEVSVRGVRCGNDLYLFPSLEAFTIDEENPSGPQLIVRSKHYFMPLIIIPIPDEFIDEIDALMSAKLPEEHLEEPLSHRLLEFFGF
jgi:hypothetical protein